MSKKVAILVDGDFFIRCYKSHLKKQFGDKHEGLNPKKLAHHTHTYCLKHINKKNDEELYRIFFLRLQAIKEKGLLSIHSKSSRSIQKPNL
ncbi:hypothetical protein HpDR37_15020 [Helicobacter pylori]